MSSTESFLRSAPTSFRFAIPTSSEPLNAGVAFQPNSPTSTTSPADTPLFSGVGGPVLILVFVACGLLIGALTAVLTLRALRPQFAFANRSSMQNDFERFDEPPSPTMNDKPAMCDMHMSASRGPARRGSGLWRNMMPLSASRVEDPVIPSRVQQKRASVSSVESACSEASMASILLSPPPRYALDLRRHSLSSSPPMRSCHSRVSPAPSEKVRVAIPIAMPRPPPPCLASPHDVDLEKASDVGYFQFQRHEEIPDFCLGITEVREKRADEWMRRLPGSP